MGVGCVIRFNAIACTAAAAIASALKRVAAASMLTSSLQSTTEMRC
jgi:hypothetical protein